MIRNVIMKIDGLMKLLVPMLENLDTNKKVSHMSKQQFDGLQIKSA